MLEQVRSRSYAFVAAGYVAGYVGLDWISYVQTLATFGITPWNPATGLSVALLLLRGFLYAPCLFLSAFAADAAVRGLPLPIGFHALSSLIIAIGYGGMCDLLLRPKLRFNRKLESERDIFLLLAFTAGTSALVAVCEIAAVYAAGALDHAQFGAAVLRYWVGDMIGVVTLTPFLLILSTRPALPRFSWEMLIPLTLLGAALWLVFGFIEALRFQLFYLLFLPVIWTAVRFGLEGVTWGLILTQVSLIVGMQLSGQSAWNLITYQALMVILSITGLVVGALVSEQQRTETQVRLQQDALARVSRLSTMGEFAAALAHEVNQPLTAIGNYVRLARDASESQPPDNARAAEAARKAGEQVKRAAEVVRRLREFMRLGHTERAPQSALNLIKAAVAVCKPELDRQSVQLSVHVIDRDLPKVLVDSLQVQQVIVNVVRNAIEAITEAAKPDGKVIIEALRDGEWFVLIRVCDNGPGFARPLFDAPLAPFTTTKPYGMGLGLSLSRSIVEAYRGRLTIGGDMNGAVVSFTLPVVPERDGVGQ